MFCMYCGNQLPDNPEIRFCPFCGKTISSVPPQPSVIPESEKIVDPPVPAVVVEPKKDLSNKQQLNKQELIAYLKAVYEAESGYDDASALLDMLQMQKIAYFNYGASFHNPDHSEIPEREDKLGNHLEYIRSQKERYEKNKKVYEQHRFSPIYITDRKVLAMDKDWLDKLQGEMLNEVRREQAQIDSQWVGSIKQLLLNEANQAMEFDCRYSLKVAAIDEVLSAFNSSIAHAAQQKAFFDVKRKELYSTGIIYDRFRTRVAAAQMCEYLVMGVCDQLEGCRGAYTMYMEDLRFEKIYDSIDKLRESVDKGVVILAECMRNIASEVREVGNKVSMLQSSLQTSFGTISSQIDRLAQSNADNIEILRKEIQTQAQPIAKAVQTSAINQYIALRQQKLNDYSFGDYVYPGYPG